MHIFELPPYKKVLTHTYVGQCSIENQFFSVIEKTYLLQSGREKTVYIIEQPRTLMRGSVIQHDPIEYFEVCPPLLPPERDEIR